MPDSGLTLSKETKAPRGKVKKRRKLRVIGWREWVGLPDLGIDRIKAKIDTGARTSALHAFRIRPYKEDGQRYVEFYIHPVQRHRKPEILCSAKVIDEREIVSSNGQCETRYVIGTRVKIGKRIWPIELTLTNRDDMSFRMLLGRQAIRRRLVVDPGSSFRMSRKKAASKNPDKER